MNQNGMTARAEWQNGWTLVLAAAAGFSFFSVMSGAGGFFIKALTEEFGWSRTLISGGISAATFVTAVLSPPVGYLIDRFGTRRVALPGLVLTIASISAFALLDGSAWQWLALWVLFGITSSAIKSTAWTAAVVGLFEKSRGLALGLTLCGTAVTQTLIGPLANWLIHDFGWRAAYVALAVGWGGITFVLCVLFLFDRRARIAGGTGTSSEKAAAVAKEAAAIANLPGLTIREAAMNTALWRLAASNFVVMLLTIGLSFHLFAILTEAGVSDSNAAWLTSLGGIAGIAGKLLSGVLLDRYRPNWIGGITLGIAAISFAFLMDGLRSPTAIVIALVINGYAAGTKMQIVGYLTAGYTGMRNFGTVYGFMSAMLALAASVGPLAAGWSYDVTGGYEAFLAAGAIGCFLSGALIVSLPRYPDWSKGRVGTRDAAALTT